MPQILLIEDDADQRALYADVLREAGYGVDESVCGSDALIQFQKKKPDLVVTDIQMPSMDGIEALSKLHELDPAVPVILHSAYPAYKANMLTWSAEAFVEKAGDTGALLKAVRRVCQSRGMPLSTVKP